ncbi:MAG: DUF4160 domain-containing protein [Stellaceae bacterium]
MPTIAVVDGVKIQMFYDDHTPPHFHVAIGGREMLVAIESLDVIRGSLPPAVQHRILVWARQHQGALAANWIKCQNAEPPERIS